MPITIAEKFDSRDTTLGDNESVELLYVVQGTDNDSEVRTLVLASSPLVYFGLIRESATLSTVGAGVWNCTVRYIRSEEEDDDQSEDGSRFTFDTGGGTQHISQSLSTAGEYAAPGEVAPKFDGAIGVNNDRVAGTDITIPVYRFTETHTIANQVVSSGYKSRVFALTGKVNSGGFRGFQKGEVLFLGASGSMSAREDWEITYRFSASPNVQGLTLGNIQGINKEGWQYLWVRFDDDIDSDAQVLIKKPVAAYVEQVYQYGDFSGLGLGG